MDISIEVGEKETGRIGYESLPVFQYLFREMGFNVNFDKVNKKVQLIPALSGKKIVISSEENNSVHSFRKRHLELRVLEQIQQFLEASGADVIFKSQLDGLETADLHIMLALLEVPNISSPLLELTQHSKFHNHKLVEVIQSECRKTDTRFKMYEFTRHEDPTLVKIQIMYQITSDDEFWNQYGEFYAITITSGILARFHGRTPLSLFSLVPVEHLLPIFTSVQQTEDNAGFVEKTNNEVVKGTRLLENAEENHIKEAEVFFDYHLLIDGKGSKKVQLIGQLHIKNSGTEILQNPIICLRATPSENINITGQILPPNFAQTKGVLNHEGAKGWQYLKEDWFEEFEEKGEIWICPIHSLIIHPRQTETLSNLQISLLNEDAQNVRVEAYVFFSDQQLEVKSNNQISLSLINKQ